MQEALVIVLANVENAVEYADKKEGNICQNMLETLIKVGDKTDKSGKRYQKNRYICEVGGARKQTPCTPARVTDTFQGWHQGKLPLLTSLSSSGFTHCPSALVPAPLTGGLHIRGSNGYCKFSLCLQG